MFTGDLWPIVVLQPVANHSSLWPLCLNGHSSLGLGHLDDHSTCGRLVKPYLRNTSTLIKVYVIWCITNI